MNQNRDEQLKMELKTAIEEIPFEEETERRLLQEIHVQLRERRKTMKFSRKTVIALAAAAVMLVGSISVIAAGKIIGFRVSSNRNEAITSIEELRETAKKELGVDVKILEALADGSPYKEGIISLVEGMDEAHNAVIKYPEVDVNYGDISMSIEKEKSTEIEAENGDAQPEYQEDYGSMQISGSEDAYLFLPPNSEPGEEDLKLQKEGRLYISYGSSEEERKVFKYVKWTDGITKYSLRTFGDKTLEEMVELAKQYIDA